MENPAKSHPPLAQAKELNSFCGAILDHGNRMKKALCSSVVADTQHGNGCWLLCFLWALVHYFLLSSAKYSGISCKLYSFFVDNWLLNIVVFYPDYVFSLVDNSFSISVWQGIGWEFQILEHCNAKFPHQDVHGIKTWLFSSLSKNP